MPILNVSGR